MMFNWEDPRTWLESVSSRLIEQSILPFFHLYVNRDQFRQQVTHLRGHQGHVCLFVSSVAHLFTLFCVFFQKFHLFQLKTFIYFCKRSLDHCRSSASWRTQFHRGNIFLLRKVRNPKMGYVRSCKTSEQYLNLGSGAKLHLTQLFLATGFYTWATPLFN